MATVFTWTPLNTTSADIDYAHAIKMYGKRERQPGNPLQPRQVSRNARSGQSAATPTWTTVSTSYAERQNLNIRMQNRRFTRLTNAFSKKAEMLAYSIAITFMYHNFVRVHQTLRTTPAVAAGIETKWKIEDMVDLIDIPAYREKVFSN